MHTVITFSQIEWKVPVGQVWKVLPKFASKPEQFEFNLFRSYKRASCMKKSVLLIIVLTLARIDACAHVHSRHAFHPSTMNRLRRSGTKAAHS